MIQKRKYGHIALFLKGYIKANITIAAALLSLLTIQPASATNESTDNHSPKKTVGAGLSNGHEGDQENPTLGRVVVEADAIPENEIDDYYNPYYKGTNSFYKRSKSTVGTKTDTPVMENPTSVQVIPKAVMNDQKSFRIKDALENVSGVRAQPSLGFGNGFIIRGFRNDKIFRNGLIASFDFFQADVDVANYDSVEVLKGPAGMLYGRSEPGGLVNTTVKKPLDIPFYSLEQQFGSYNHYRTEWDATGPITKNNNILYRVSGSYQDNESFRDLVFNKRVTVSPSITWRITDATDFTFNIEGVDQEFQADFGIPALGNRPAPVNISNNYDDPNSPVDHFSKIHLSTELNHRFNDDWAVHSRFLATHQETDTSFTNPAPAFGTALLPDNRTLQRNLFFQEDDAQIYATNLDLTGKFDIGLTKHQTLVGFDFMQGYTGYHIQGDWENPNPALNIDLYNPRASYGIDPALIKSTLATSIRPGANFNMFKNQWYGIYFQDQITLFDKLHITGGGRQDWTENGRGRGASFAQANYNLENSSPTVLRRDNQFSPRVGILYEPWQWLSVYGNWTNTFGVNNGVDSGGASIAPETSEQFELGIKTQLFDQRLLATLAYYHLTKNNLMTSDPSTPDPTDSAAIGQARSQGIELDLSGQITDHLSVIGSYAYTDARITKNNDGGQGARLPNVAEHSGSLWLKYDFKGYDAVDGLSVGLGGVAAGTREGNYFYYGPEAQFKLPGYVRMDAFAAYKWNVKKVPITAQINIRNLLDHTYYESTDPDSNVSPQNSIIPGAPLMAIGSIKVEY